MTISLTKNNNHADNTNLSYKYSLLMKRLIRVWAGLSLKTQVLVDKTLPPPPIVIFLWSDDHVFCIQQYKITNLDVFLFQYIKQIPEIIGFWKSEFAAHITLKGWQLHLEKASPLMEKPKQKTL